MTVMTHTFYASPHGTSESALRTRAQGIFDAFLACGWKQTDDTGQAVPSELTYPGTVSTVAGYGVFRLDDALQSTAPVFTRLEFFRADTNVGMVLRAQVGSATDGAGNIVGRPYSDGAYVLHRSGANITQEYLCYASGDGSSFNLVMYEGDQRCSMLAIERSRSASGAPTGESILVVGSAPSSGPNEPSRVAVTGSQGTYGVSRSAGWEYLPSSLPWRVNGVTIPHASLGISPGGGMAPAFPAPLAAPGVTPWISSNLLVIHPSDVSATSSRQRATINGKERTYRATSAWGVGGVVYMDSTVSARAFPAILWSDEE